MSSDRLLPVCLAFAVLITVPASTFGQEVGVKAGINSASLTPLEDQEPDVTRRLGPVAGIWVRTPAQGRWSFQGEGLFTEKGVEWAFGPDINVRIRLRYFEIPLLARADFSSSGSGTRVYAVGGAAPAFKLSVRSTVRIEDQQRTSDDDDEFYGWDVGLVGGLGVEFGRVQVEGRYTHGIRHINTDDNGDEDRVRNRVFAVTAGFRIR